jgi:predicted small secreted protein
MKPTKIIAIVALVSALLTSCSTTTGPDGTTTTAADPALTQAATVLAVEAIHAYANRKITAEK